MGLVQGADTWCPEAWKWPPDEKLRAFLEAQLETIARLQCLRRRLPHDLVDDVRQETYMALFLRQEASPQSFEEFSSECRRIADNAARRQLRPLMKTAAPLPEEVPGRPHDASATEESILAVLPDRLTQALFEAKFVDGFSWDEIAKAFGLSRWKMQSVVKMGRDLIRAKYPHLPETEAGA